MDRTRSAALVIAVVLGTLGGFGTAVSTVPDAGSPADAPEASSDPEPGGGPSLSESPSDEETAEPNDPLLYYAGGVLHDGDRTVDLDPSGSLLARTRVELPSALVRREGGYLLAVPSETEGAEDVFSIDEDGTESLVGQVAPGWDLNLQGTRIVGRDLTEDLLTVWDSTDGTPITRWDRGFGEGDSAAYAGSEDQVLVSKRLNPRDYRLLRWDVAAGETSRELLVGYDRMGVSPGGSYVAGTVGPDGAGSEDQAFCLQLHQTYLRSTEASWQTCDWRAQAEGRPQFSPDGTRLLAVPSATEGDPASFVVIDASDGPDPLVAQVDAPEGTLSATWADDDSLWVTGQELSASSASNWVRRCDLDGRCEEAVPGEAGEVVVGEIR